MNVEEIKNYLPHRYPFLLVDRVIEKTDNAIVCIKNVTANEPFFQGHFPNKPVMPGVLLIEAMAQAGAVLLLSRPENKGKIAYLAAIDEARFRKVVIPGDQLRLEVELVKLKSKIGVMKGRITVEGEEVSSAEVLFTFA